MPKLWISVKLWLAVASLLAGVIFGVCYFRSIESVRKNLATIPKEDRDALEWLFYHLNHSGCSYVLFGEKPMGIASFLKAETHSVAHFRDICSRVSFPNIKINRGWEAWKKYQHLFPSSNFILLENRDLECITLVMIHRRHFFKKVAENIDVFREVLGDAVTPQIVLEKCMKSNNIIRDVLKGHDGLLGILLGFGRENALLFSRRTQIEKGNLMIPSTGFSTIEEEYQSINNRLTSFTEEGIPDLNPCLMPMLGFMADSNHPETQSLREEYKKEYKKIIDRYKKGDFLEVTLKQFCL